MLNLFSHLRGKRVKRTIVSIAALSTWGIFFGASPTAFASELLPVRHVVEPKNLSTHHLRIKGRISDGRYYGAGDFFSLSLPATADASQVEDFFMAPNIGGVAFYNDDGFLLKIEVDELLPEVSHLIRRHPEIKEEILDALFSDALLLQIKQTVPKLQVLQVKMIQLPSGDPALFAVLDLPEAATLVDTQTGRNLDSKRGYLIFFADNFDLVSMSLQDTLSFLPNLAEAAKTRLNDRLLNHLLYYQSTFRVDSDKRVSLPKSQDNPASS